MVPVTVIRYSPGGPRVGPLQPTIGSSAPTPAAGTTMSGYRLELKRSGKISPASLCGSLLNELSARKYTPGPVGEKRWSFGSREPRTPMAASSFE